MNHAGKPMSDTVNQPRAFEILTAEPVKKRRPPRDWSDDVKARLVAETLLPGANVSSIARSAGVDPSQLYGWRRKALSSGAVTPLSEVTGSEVRFARLNRWQAPWWRSSSAISWFARRAMLPPNTWRRFCGRFA